MKGIAATFILFLLIAGHKPPSVLKESKTLVDTSIALVPQAVIVPAPDTIITTIKKEEPVIKTGNLQPRTVVAYAKKMIGVPYRYGSTDPKKGFDCSGFITYVFNHFKVKVPRSSKEFTDVGSDVNYQASKPGDLILFTGTDSTIRTVGHMGIVVSNENNKLSFIHSTSGKKYGVTISEFSPHYMSRLVRVARIFPESAYELASNKRGKERDIENDELNDGPSSPGVKNETKLNSSKKTSSANGVKSKSVTSKVSTTKTSSTTKKTTATTSKKTITTKKSSTSKSSPKKTTKAPASQSPQKKKSTTVSSSSK